MATLENYGKLVGILSHENDRERFAAPDGKTHRSYKAWVTAHEGARVDTLQASFPDDTGEIYMPWAPANRMVEARSTFALFNGSRRDYKGVKVLASDENTIVATDGEQVWAHTTNVKD